MYLFHAQSTLSRRSSVQQPVVGVWSCENKVRKRVEVKSKILQSSTKKALKTSLIVVDELQSYIGLKADTENPVIITCTIGRKPKET